jgi:hypothetical protein
VPIGEASLIVQHVERQSTCGKDWLGYDLLVETKLDEAKTSTKRHLFCPPGKKNMFEMCKTYQRCTIDALEAGATIDRVTVRCDKDTIVLETTPKSTHVTGPDLDLEVAPVRLRILPAKKLTRAAFVDC